MASNSIPEYVPQFSTEWIDDRYIHRAIDGAVTMASKDGSCLPMVFVEIDKHEHDPILDHKDLVKIAITMGAALKWILGYLSR